MKQKLKKGSAIGALLMAMVISPLVSAATMDFTNNSGVYVGSDGTIATATPNTSGLTYSSTNGGGIGVGTGTSTVGSGEFITILFNQRVTIQSALLAQWANPFLVIFVQDRVQFSYPVNGNIPTGSVLTSANSLSSSVGTFNLGSVSVDGIRIANPQTGGWTVQRINYTTVPLPATAWLFGTALLGLGLMKRKKA
jgi:hypothetical protein